MSPLELLDAQNLPQDFERDRSLTPTEAKTVDKDAVSALDKAAKKESDFQFEDSVERSVVELFQKLVTSTSDNIGVRKRLVWWVYGLVVVWLAFVAALVIMNGAPSGFELTDSILDSLITSSTIAIIGLLATVVTYYFTDRGIVKQVYGDLIDYLKNRRR